MAVVSVLLENVRRIRIVVQDALTRALTFWTEFVMFICCLLFRVYVWLIKVFI